MNEPLRLVSQPVAPDDLAEATRSFEDFVASEHSNLYGALRLITRDRFEAEDLMQDAFLKVWERWDRIRLMDDPSGYLYRTALNLYRKRLRRAAVAIRRAIQPSSTRDELSDVEAQETVLRALARLTPRQRMSVLLVDLLDYSSEEAGRLMGIKSTTVRVLASQGRATLRRSAGDGDE
jgi:RNA polymerase sigma-70 factor (ECF subfamily)